MTFPTRCGILIEWEFAHILLIFINRTKWHIDTMSQTGRLIMQVLPKLTDENQILKVQSHLRNQVMTLLTHPTAQNVALAKSILKEVNKLDKLRNLSV